MRSSLRLHALLILLAVVSLGGCGSSGDSENARVRLLNVSPGYQSLDFYINSEDDSTDSLRTAGVSYGSVSGYTELKTGTYTVKLKRNGVTSTLQTLSDKKFAEDSHRMFLAYGSSGHFATLDLGEDFGAPDSGKAMVRLLNTAEAGSLDVYLTESSVALEDATPIFSTVASGNTGGPTTMDSGDYRLRITGTNDIDDLRLDVPSVSLGSKQVLNLILTATQGGVLVNALLMPQQGGITEYANTKSRLRGAVGIANGSTVTARVGGVGVLSSAAVGVVGNYVQVDAGSTPVSLSINGAPVAIGNQALTAGGDYTLLVWSDASGTQTSLISDDNRLPTTSGRAKIRVMNGLSALGVPVTMAVDFFPVSEGIVLGQASAYSEVDGGSEYQLDISNTDTAVNLLSKNSVLLQDAGVYTMFMSVNGTTVGGTLRKDR